MRDTRNQSVRTLRPGEKIWLTWSEIQGMMVRIRGDFIQGTRERIFTSATSLGVSQEAATHSCRHLDQLLQRIRGGEFEPEQGSSIGEPAFCLRGLPRPILDRIRKLQATHREEDLDKSCELLVRYGCRAHRNFLDRDGASLPFRFAASDGAYTVMSEETFEMYAVSNIAGTLAAAIWMHQ